MKIHIDKNANQKFFLIILASSFHHKAGNVKILEEKKRLQYFKKITYGLLIFKKFFN